MVYSEPPVVPDSCCSNNECSWKSETCSSCILGSSKGYQIFKLNMAGVKETSEAEQYNWEFCLTGRDCVFNPTYTMREVLSITTETHLHQH